MAGRFSLLVTGAGNQATVTATNVTIAWTGSGTGLGVQGNTGAATLTSTGGTIKTTANSSTGINVQAGGAGTARLINSTAVTTGGTGARGIRVSAANGIAVVENSGAIITTGESATGLQAYSSNGASVTVMNSATIRVDGASAEGILATGGAGAAIDVDNTGSTITMVGNNAFAIKAQSGGTVRIHNTATLSMGGANAMGIFSDNGINTADIINTGAINMAAESSVGIRASGGGMIDIDNSGAIDLRAAYSTGIYASSDGGVDITSTGLITAAGDYVVGIYADNNTTTTSITNDAAIGVNGLGAAGLLIRAGADTVLTVNASVIAEGNYAAGINAFGDPLTITIANGVSVMGGWQADATGTGPAASTGVVAPAISPVLAAGVIVGSYSVVADPAGVTLTNNGTIGALSDRAIAEAQRYGVGTIMPLMVTNTGTITGFVELSDGAATFNNLGLFDLRHFADADGDGVRDTKRVAVLDFGGGNDSFTNQASGVLRLAAVAGATTINTTGYYVPTTDGAPLDASFYNLTREGVVQSQLTNLETFSNSGTIDLRGPAVGNMLIITGGAGVAGGVLTPGNGVYVANGGKLLVNAVLNAGGANSQADVLVVDSTRLGTAATVVEVTPVGGTGALTTSNGIMLVEVLDKTASAPGVFVMPGRVVGGAFEYRLFHGGAGANATDGNWYLRSEQPSCEKTNSCPIVPTDNGGDNSGNQPTGVPEYRAEVGAYLGNQMAAVSMFRHTLHDRAGEGDFLERQRGVDEGRHAGSWARVIGSLTDSMAAANQLDLRTRTGLAQAGFELGRWTDGASRLVMGVMAGAGTAHTNSQSGYTAKGTVDGYSVGLYGTWYQSARDARGLYIDTWVQHGWFDNTVKGDQLASQSYDSRALSASLEAGYAFEIGRGASYAYYIEPQAQVIYTDYSADAHHEADTGTLIRPDDAGGFLTRLGARVYTRSISPTAQYAVQPFVEFNWWRSTEGNSMLFDAHSVSQNLPQNTFETKLGAEAALGERWTMWGHAGLRVGADDFRDVNALLGVKYSW